MSAVLSPCGTYRYELRRTWDASKSSVLWVMLNPSTTDATDDDPTIRRCIGFARSWGYGGIVVANLYALRSTNPKALWSHRDPVGPDNDATIRRLVEESGLVVAAWGVSAPARRAWEVRHAVTATGRVLYVVGTTKGGQPKHPLYVKGDTQPIAWTSA